MAYISTVNNQAYTIDTGESSDQRVITINGTRQSIDWRRIAPLAADARGQTATGGRYSLLIGGKSYEIFARRITKPDEKDGDTYEVQVAGQRFEVHVEDEREKALAGSIKGAHESGEAMVRAPMPGLVLGITLEIGAHVERGQTVVILEAMKMENDLGSPIAGTIKEVRVNKGQTVNQGDVLVVVSGE
jgi:biotin carboxyl carrier protein